jgi:adenylate cyclase
VANSEISKEVPDKPDGGVTNPEISERVPDKPPSDEGLRGRIRTRLKLVGGVLAWVATVGAVAGGLVGYWNVWRTVRTDVFQEGQRSQREAVARSAPRWSLIVLPFANLNNDPEQDFFADAITTDLTTDLAQMPDAFVIGRETAFTYKSKTIDLRTLWKDLGIRWAVQGAVRRNGDQIRVNVSLTDLQTARDTWSDRFDGDRTKLPDLQDQITARLARSLNIELIQAEGQRSEAERSKNPDSMDFSMRGWAKLLGSPASKIQCAQAKQLFDSALRQDPENVDAMIGKAGSLSGEMINGWSVSFIEDKQQATDLIDRALSRSPRDWRAHLVKGNILLFGQPEGALAHFDAALEINPNLHAAYASKGAALILLGRAREAISSVHLALRISPRDPYTFLWHWVLCNVYLHLQEYEEAIEACRRSMIMNNSFVQTYISLISAYGSTGELDQARQLVAELDKRYPDFAVRPYRQQAYALSSNAQYRREVDDILDGLRKGGGPEQ